MKTSVYVFFYILIGIEIVLTFLNLRKVLKKSKKEKIEKIIRMHTIEMLINNIAGKVINVKLIENGIMPEYKTEGAACADCYARVDTDVVVKPGTSELINLGFAIELPDEYEAVIRPRSGISNNVIAIEGTIDSDYRGEVKGMLFNYSKEDYIVKNGDRICQMKIQPARQCIFKKVETLSETERGSNSFGSTGR